MIFLGYVKLIAKEMYKTLNYYEQSKKKIKKLFFVSNKTSNRMFIFILKKNKINQKPKFNLNKQGMLSKFFNFIIPFILQAKIIRAKRPKNRLPKACNARYSIYIICLQLLTNCSQG